MRLHLLVYEAHRWALPDPPVAFLHIADSVDGCEIFVHGKRPLVGFQFHPELFVDTASGFRLLENALHFITAS